MTAHWPMPAGLHTASARLPVEGELPSLDGATEWLNSPPLTPAGLRGGLGPACVSAGTGLASTCSRTGRSRVIGGVSAPARLPGVRNELTTRAKSAIATP